VLGDACAPQAAEKMSIRPVKPTAERLGIQRETATPLSRQARDAWFAAGHFRSAIFRGLLVAGFRLFAWCRRPPRDQACQRQLQKSNPYANPCRFHGFVPLPEQADEKLG
jgi:hypothetical protein